MIKLITGDKGKGKTSYLINAANEAVKTANGTIVYLDKSSKHMYDLNNKVRLINLSTLPIKNTDQFIGAISGILSQDHDLEAVYFDNLKKISMFDGDEAKLDDILTQLEEASNLFKVDFIITVSMEGAYSGKHADKVILSL